MELSKVPWTYIMTTLVLSIFLKILLFIFILTKHIEIHHHFIRELVEDKVVSLEFVPFEQTLAYIFTKPSDSFRFEFLRKFLGICLIN